MTYDEGHGPAKAAFLWKQLDCKGRWSETGERACECGSLVMGLEVVSLGPSVRGSFVLDLAEGSFKICTLLRGKRKNAVLEP